jgi:hypothetical protein
LHKLPETLFEVTIPDSSIAKPAAMNMTRKPQIKNNRVLKINPTSADTVVSAIPALLMFNKNTKLSNGAVILFINLVIRPPVKVKTYNFINFKN